MHPSRLFCVKKKEMEREINHLKTKSIHAPSDKTDGHRISIMSRHTLNDGVTLDPLITEESYDKWLKELAPPDTLIGAYYKRGLPWDKFERQYVEFLRKIETQSAVEQLLDLVKTQNVTLLCVEDTPEYCHRRLLAEECQRLEPNLELTVL
jgi:uncharacterized protein YeaO (DUF488 family)